MNFFEHQEAARRHTALLVFYFAMAVVLMCTSMLRAQLVFEVSPLYLEGDPAPGTSDQFETFDRPCISDSGSVFFAGCFFRGHALG